MTTPDLLGAILRFLLIVPAIILHEISHGWVALLLGDPTAKNRGRLTLNPIPHIDPWGTVVLPGAMLIASTLLGGAPIAFGYAKPVPVNPYLMHKTDPRTGMLLTGLAGPACNILIAVLTAGVVHLIPVSGLAANLLPNQIAQVLVFFAFINLVLAFFNLIPVPPLDGSRVVQWLLRGEALQFYDSLERYGFIVVIAIVFIFPGVIDAYFGVTVYPILHLLGIG
jgi:Zn-dependent protease